MRTSNVDLILKQTNKQEEAEDLIVLPDWKNLIVYSDWLLLTVRCVVIGWLLIERLSQNQVLNFGCILSIAVRKSPLYTDVHYTQM